MASMEQAMLSSQEIDGNYYEVQTSNQLSLFNLGQTWGKPRSTQGLSFRKSPELGYPIYKWKMSYDYWS